MRPSSSSDFSMVILISQPAWKNNFVSQLEGITCFYVNILWNKICRNGCLGEERKKKKNAAWIRQQLKMPTLSVTGFVYQARVLCQLCVDFCHLTRKWREKLTGSLYTFQGTKLLWNTNTQAAHMSHCKARCWKDTVPHTADSYLFVQVFGRLQEVHSTQHHLTLPIKTWEGGWIISSVLGPNPSEAKS